METKKGMVTKSIRIVPELDTVITSYAKKLNKSFNQIAVEALLLYGHIIYDKALEVDTFLKGEDAPDEKELNLECSVDYLKKTFVPVDLMYKRQHNKANILQMLGKDGD